MKELVLEEDEECGCQCAGISATHCAGHFNEMKCECECRGAELEEAKQRCQGREGVSFWDERRCECRSRSVAPRGIDAQDPSCIGHQVDNSRFSSTVYESREASALSVISYVVLGCCLTAAVFLSLTTIHYRGKLRKLVKESESSTMEQGGEKRRLRRPTWVASNGDGRSARQTRSLEDAEERYEDQYDSHGVLIKDQVMTKREGSDIFQNFS